MQVFDATRTAAKHVVIGKIGFRRAIVSRLEASKTIGRMPGEGLEPSRYCYRRILSPLRLPFRHPGRRVVRFYADPLLPPRT